MIVPSKATADALACARATRRATSGSSRWAPTSSRRHPEERARILEAAEGREAVRPVDGNARAAEEPRGCRARVRARDRGGRPGRGRAEPLPRRPAGLVERRRARADRRAGLADRVRRIDAQPVPVRAALYAEASVFVFPSLAEGFGLPVLEAMACGTPVVTSNRSSLPEVAGSAAELCDPNDHESIGSAIAKVLRDTDLADDLRRLGSRRAKEYTWERTAQRPSRCTERCSRVARHWRHDVARRGRRDRDARRCARRRRVHHRAAACRRSVRRRPARLREARATPTSSRAMLPKATLHPVRVGGRAARIAWSHTRPPATRAALASGRVPRAALHAAAGLRCPAVVTFHDPTFFTHPELHERAKVAYFTRAARSGIARAARVIAVSEYARRGAIEHAGADPDARRRRARRRRSRRATRRPRRQPNRVRTSCSSGRSSRARTCRR